MFSRALRTSSLARAWTVAVRCDLASRATPPRAARADQAARRAKGSSRAACCRSSIAALTASRSRSPGACRRGVPLPLRRRRRATSPGDDSEPTPRARSWASSAPSALARASAAAAAAVGISRSSPRLGRPLAASFALNACTSASISSVDVVLSSATGGTPSERSRASRPRRPSRRAPRPRACAAPRWRPPRARASRRGLPPRAR